MPMKVAMLAYELFPFNLGGLGIHIAEISQELDKICDLEVFVPFRMKLDDLKIVTVPVKDAKKWVTVKYKPEKVALYNKLLVNKFGACKSDIVHSHDWVTADGGRRVKEKFGVPFVLTIHSTTLGRKDYTGVFNKEKHALEKSIYSADRIITVSEKMKEEVVSHYSIDPKIIRVVYNGIDTSEFRTGPEKKFLLFIGRISPMKGVKYLLEAYRKVRESFPDYKLFVCGEGEYKKEILKYAKEAGLSDHVNFKGIVSQEELVKLYSTSTMVCLPSIYEPFGLTVLEGAASGKPVITTNKSGASELVDNWKNAVVVKAGDSADLAKAMIRLLEDKELRKRVGKNATTLANKYSWKLAAKETLKVYEELV
jgi:glycosyltransferase involved in cell wall biosynthesis